MSNSRLDGVRKGTRIPDLLLRRQSLYPTELYGPIVLKPAISRGLTPYIVFFGLDNILSEEGIIHGLLLSIYCRVGSHFSRRFELTTELQFFSRLVLALFLRRRTLYPAELRAHVWNCLCNFVAFSPPNFEQNRKSAVVLPGKGCYNSENYSKELLFGLFLFYRIHRYLSTDEGKLRYEEDFNFGRFHQHLSGLLYT